MIHWITAGAHVLAALISFACIFIAVSEASKPHPNWGRAAFYMATAVLVMP